MIRIPAQHNIYRCKRLTPQKVLVHQQFIEFHSPPSLAMIYPAALRHFMANAFYRVAPLHMSGASGGRANNPHNTAGANNASSNQSRPHVAQTPRPRQSASANNGAYSYGGRVQSTGSRKRTSPRLHNRQPGPALEVQQNKRLRGSVKALYPLNEEGSVPSPSRNNHHGDDEVSRLSDDLLWISYCGQVLQIRVL